MNKAVSGIAEFLPQELRDLVVEQETIPAIAKNERILALIENAVQTLPTSHSAICGDARKMGLSKESIHLVVTSPPYWTLKKYNESANQMGDIADYDMFLKELDRVWKQCFDALVPGGRLVCVVGDVCLSRKQNNGRHTVIPLHASIQERCVRMGFDNLAPIIWHKIANAVYEASGNGGGFLGKPYEPNAVIKNDIEFILMFRKPGGYRSPDPATRLLSVISESNHRQWFQQIWTGVTGASTRNHPAPYPLSLAERLIKMFSFAGDTVLDPFLGTGTTTIAALKSGRNSVGFEVDPKYFKTTKKRIQNESGMFFKGSLRFDEEN
jgi:DNA modification methylase